MHATPTEAPGQKDTIPMTDFLARLDRLDAALDQIDPMYHRSLYNALIGALAQAVDDATWDSCLTQAVQSETRTRPVPA